MVLTPWRSESGVRGLFRVIPAAAHEEDVSSWLISNRQLAEPSPQTISRAIAEPWLRRGAARTCPGTCRAQPGARDAITPQFHLPARVITLWVTLFAPASNSPPTHALGVLGTRCPGQPNGVREGADGGEQPPVFSMSKRFPSFPLCMG